MPASNSAAFSHPSESDSEQFVHFAFPVTWSFLPNYTAVPKPEPKPERNRLPSVFPPRDLAKQSVPLSEAPPISEPAPTRPPLELATVPAPVRTTVDRPEINDRKPDRWEMVIPKMRRPSSQPAKLLDGSPREPKTVEAALPVQPPAPPEVAGSVLRADTTGRLNLNETIRGSVLPQRAVESTLDTPSFAFTEKQPLRVTPQMVTIGASALGCLLLAGVLMFSLKPTASQNPAASFEAGPAFSAPLRWTPLTEFPRRISILRDSANLTDFRIDFRAQNIAKAMGWVFRAKDAKNYYAMRLEITQAATSSSSAVLKRFAVIDGQDQLVMRIPLTISVRPGAMYQVRTEGTGRKFTTWISDRKVDEWTDAQFSSGGVGVYNERNEPATALGDLAVFPLVKK